MGPHLHPPPIFLFKKKVEKINKSGVKKEPECVCVCWGEGHSVGGEQPPPSAGKAQPGGGGVQPSDPPTPPLG